MRAKRSLGAVLALAVAWLALPAAAQAANDLGVTQALSATKAKPGATIEVTSTVTNLGTQPIPEAHVELAAERGEEPPIVELDARFYKLLADFEARFPSGAPSLVECERLAVRGDVVFGAGVVVRGSVEVAAENCGQLRVEDGAVLA